MTLWGQWRIVYCQSLTLHRIKQPIHCWASHSQTSKTLFCFYWKILKPSSAGVEFFHKRRVNGIKLDKTRTTDLQLDFPDITNPNVFVQLGILPPLNDFQEMNLENLSILRVEIRKLKDRREAWLFVFSNVFVLSRRGRAYLSVEVLSADLFNEENIRD